MNQPWPMVPLGELITLERRAAEVTPEGMYPEVGVYCFGNGLFFKQPRIGLEVGDKKLFYIRERDFILQVTFAWEGAVAVASKHAENYFGSVRVLTFRANETRCIPEFLLHYFRTREGVDKLAAISPGSAGRNRVLNVKQLPGIKIPLPPLPEQRRLVARIDALSDTIANAHRQTEEVMRQMDALGQSVSHAVFESAHAKNWKTVPLGEVSEIRSGVTLGRRLQGATISVPYLRVANVQDGYLDLSEIKEVSVLAEEVEKWKLEPGDLLLTEGGDWDKLGRGTVWQDEIAGCIHQNHIFRVRTNRNQFYPDFLAAAVSSPYGKAYFQGASKQTTNLASINQRQLKAFPLPMPSLAEQRRVVEYVRGVSHKIETAKNIQKSTAAELDALLPSILDKAFRGEL